VLGITYYEQESRKRAGVSLVYLGPDLRNAAEHGCSDSRFGPLPDFETLLIAITNQMLDPCQYAPGSDYRKVIEEQRATFSYARYSEWVEQKIERFVSRAQPAQRQCFFNFLLSELLARRH
jgi:hypothetical protein